MKTPAEKFTNNSGGSDSIRSSLSTSAILKELPISIGDIDAEDVIFYAKLIGIDPFLESHLLWIAQAGLVSPLPVGWIAVEDHKQRLYYYNWTTGKSSWEHPNDHHYKSLVRKYRKKSRKAKSKSQGQSPSCFSASHSLTANQTTMSSISSMGNLHFFEDDNDDDFKDLLKPQTERAKTGFSSSTKSLNKSFDTPNQSSGEIKALPTKEDSIESVEFDLENSNELIEDDEDSIASLEALQNDRKIDSTKVFQSQSTGEKLAPTGENDKKGKEDSDPESDHWNSLPDNEQDPFQDLFQRGSEKEKNETTIQRPMSAKVRSSVVAQTEEPMTNRSNAKKHLSILEEEEDGQMEEDDNIEEVFEDEDIEEVYEVEEELKTESINAFDKPIILFEAPKVSLPQMSQMGRINGNASAHLEPSAIVEKSAKINELNISTGVGVNSALNVQQTEKPTTEMANISRHIPVKPELSKGNLIEVYDDDFESESMNSPVKVIDSLKFEKMGKKLEEQIATLRTELNSDINSSQNDLSIEFKQNLGELNKKIEKDKSEIRFITERVDKLWNNLKNFEKANQNDSSVELLDEKFDQFKQNLLEVTSEKVFQLEKKLNASQVEDSKRVLEQSKRVAEQFKDELAGTISEVKRMTQENSTTIELLREDLKEQLHRQQNQSRQVQNVSERFQELHASLGEEMERRIEKKLNQELTKFQAIRSIGESTSTEKNQVELNQQKEMLNSRLDQLQDRIDLVLQEIDGKLERIEAKRNAECSLPHSTASSAKPTSQKPISQLKINGRRHSANNTTTDISETEMTEEQEQENDQEMETQRTVVKKKQLNIINDESALRKSKMNEEQKQLNEPKISGSSKSKPSLNENPIIIGTLSQCKALQQTLHYCAMQLNDTIKQLNLHDERNPDHESSVNEARHHKRTNYHNGQKKGNKSSKMSRSQETILDTEGEENQCEDVADSSTSMDCRANYRFRVYESVKSTNNRLSQSTPNLLHNCHCQHYVPKGFKNTRKLQFDLDTDPFNRMATQRLHHSSRAERQIRSIKSSSHSLIQQIKQTSNKLRQELSSLQNLNEEPKSSMFGPSELVILKKTMGKFKEESESQPRIFFEDTAKKSDENLIRQLRSIRNTVNERLQKMALDIEQQKTTKI